ncbi:MAG TPA: nucleoside hydrolase-like domain-containing protein [Pirellulales bacterium]
MARRLVVIASAVVISVAGTVAASDESLGVNATRLRVIIETDAGGDPDDEQSLVRFLLYANEWDIEGIVANRSHAQNGENKNRERTGLGIVRAMVSAYGDCWNNLSKHDGRYPTSESLWKMTVAGYDDSNDGVERILSAVDRDDPRPIWYADWGTASGGGKNNLRRALERVLKERGPEGYAKFKRRLRLASADAFGEHTREISPAFALWIDTFRPQQNGKRWYHSFSGLTAIAGGFDIERDVRTAHGALGKLYPLNTTHRQKEGDTMTFLYLVPTGMNDPEQPTWGSWGGRYSRQTDEDNREYYWADAQDRWNGTTSRENTLARWAVAIQSDFAARADWCVADTIGSANHPPVAVLNDDRSKAILRVSAKSGERVVLSAAGSSDPDDDVIHMSWYLYPEAGTFQGECKLDATEGVTTSFTAPVVDRPASLHVVLELSDKGKPSLVRYRRTVVTLEP